MGEHRKAQRANFVGRISIGRNTVSADDYGIYQALFHERGSHVVTLQRHGHPGLSKLPHRKASTLIDGSSLVGIHAIN